MKHGSLFHQQLLVLRNSLIFFIAIFITLCLGEIVRDNSECFICNSDIFHNFVFTYDMSLIVFLIVRINAQNQRLECFTDLILNDKFMRIVSNYRIFNECCSSPKVIISSISLNHIFIKLAAEDIILSKKYYL